MITPNKAITGPAPGLRYAVIARCASRRGFASIKPTFVQVEKVENKTVIVIYGNNECHK